MRVKVLGASSPFPPARLAAGHALLAGHGVDVNVDDALAADSTHAYLNGDDVTRARLLNEALASDVDVVWLARGGYGITRLLPRLAVPERGAHVPIVVGFSDVTALFSWMHRHGHAARAIHAPLVTALPNEHATDAGVVVDVVRAVVDGRAVSATHALTTLVPGEAQGPLFVANVCVLAALCGTPAQPDLRGHIVVLEEIGERPYRLDRMLTQLVAAGVFDGVAGVAVGHLTACSEPTQNANPARPAPAPVDVFVDVLGDVLRARGAPLVHGVPCGHEAPNHAFPLAASSTLVAQREGSARLSWHVAGHAGHSGSAT